MSNNNSQKHKPDRTPRIVQGIRQISMAALQERIEAQFLAENSLPLLIEAATDPARRDLVRDAADYVLAIEAVVLTRPERNALLEKLYANLFRFGPLDQYISDDSVTEITINGADDLHVRIGADAMQPIPTTFDDPDHLSKVVGRVLSTAGVHYDEQDEATPFLEVGIMMLNRPMRLTVAKPPISPVLHVDIRLHPAKPLTLDDLIGRGVLDQPAADWLLNTLKDARGMMIVGDVGTGKTTLLNALLHALPGQSAIVERSAELRVPPDMYRFSGVDFAGQINAALEKHPPWLVLDEIRLDESDAMWAALSGEPPPHMLWAFRGATALSRVRAAFSMAVRRAQPTLDESAIVNALVDQLPVIAVLARKESTLRLITLGEWTRDGEGVILKPFVS